jgi:hypothetical protein
MATVLYGLYRVAPSENSPELPADPGLDDDAEFMGWFVGDPAGAQLFQYRVALYNAMAGSMGHDKRLALVLDDKKGEHAGFGTRTKEVISSLLGRSRYYTVAHMLPEAPGVAPDTMQYLGFLWADPQGRNDFYCMLWELPGWPRLALYDQRKDEWYRIVHELPKYLWPPYNLMGTHPGSLGPDWVHGGTICRDKQMTPGF